MVSITLDISENNFNDLGGYAFLKDTNKSEVTNEILSKYFSEVRNGIK